MSKPYEVLERSFINGRLYEPGEHVTLEIDSPGGNLKLAGSARAAAPINAQTPTSPQIGYASARTGGGKFVVKDAAGNVAGSFMGSKAEADTEADRLNAGGEPINAQTPASESPVVPPSTESGAPADGNSTGNLPDA